MKKGTVTAAVDFSTALRERGMRVTDLRLRVLEELANQHRPISLTDLTSRITGAYPVTIYRIVADLKQANLVRQVDFQQAHALYELTDPEDHHHLVCTSCARIESFHACAADEITPKVLQESKYFNQVKTHSFELFGLCKTCAKGAA